MVGKSKHHLTKIVRFPHKEAVTGIAPATLQIYQVYSNPKLEFTTLSTTKLNSSQTKTATKTGPETYYVKPTGIVDNSYVGNTKYTIGPFNNSLKLGAGIMDLNKIRITKIKITTRSNVNSEILYPSLKLNIKPSSSTIEQNIDAFRLNPGGFAGFNIYKITGEQWDKGGTIFFSAIKNNESLFKSGTYYHNELP